MRKGAQISVFLSLIFIIMCSLMCGFVETARTAGARWYLQLSINSAVDSLFSKYHKDLWNQYRIFGKETKELKIDEMTMEFYLSQYLEMNSWYPIENSFVNFNEAIYLTDTGGKYLEHEVLEYMKYGVWNNQEYSVDMGARLHSDLKEASAISKVIDSYQDYSKNILELELILEEISAILDNQQQLYTRANSALDHTKGSEFIKIIKQMEKGNQKLPILVERYIKCADQLSIKLEKTRKEQEANNFDITHQNLQSLNLWMDQYQAYINEDGIRRKEVLSLLQVKEANEQLLTNLIREAEEIQKYIEEWDSDEEGETLDEEDLWKPVQYHFMNWKNVSFSFSFGIKDKEKQNSLEMVRGMCGLTLLSFVMPEDMVLSKMVLSDGEITFDFYFPENETNEEQILNKVIINEYCGRFFSNALSEENDFIHYEMEYLLAGHNKDDKNLESAVHTLLLIRKGFNLIYLISDSQKREQARALATIIAGGAGIPALIAVIAYLVIIIWALGESMMDLKTILKGEKVALFKDSDSWRLSLEGLLEMGRNQTVSSRDNDQHGISYLGYLKLALLLERPQVTYYRMLSLMQMNLRRKQKDFSISHCLYYVDVEATVCGRHLFSSLAIVEKYNKIVSRFYTMRVTTQKKY